MSCLYCGQSNTKLINGYCIKYSCESRAREEIKSRERARDKDFVEVKHEFRMKYHKTCFTSEKFEELKSQEGKLIVYGKTLRDPRNF